MWAFVLIGLFLGSIGLAIRATPPEALMKWDRQTGYAIYKRAPDHESGLRNAGTFYRLFGGALAAVGLLVAAGALLVALAG